MKHFKKFGHLRCYHTIEVDSVSFDRIEADPRFTADDSEYKPLYFWLGERLGFYPIFMAIGNPDVTEINQEAIRTTGYANQFGRTIGEEWTPEHGDRKIRRQKGEFPNYAMLVFPLSAIDERVVFNDYSQWEDCHGAIWNDMHIPHSTRTGLFHKSWSRSKWLRHAHCGSTTVQLCVPAMDMRQACEVWVRNRPTKKRLEAMGFRNVVVKRLSLSQCD